MGNNPTILAIETSCDETAAAVVRGGKEIISNQVASQIAIHEQFGGVVPEVASRHHVQNMTTIVKKTLEEAELTYADLDAIAVTEGPGLLALYSSVSIRQRHSLMPTTCLCYLFIILLGTFTRQILSKRLSTLRWHSSFQAVIRPHLYGERR